MQRRNFEFGQTAFKALISESELSVKNIVGKSFPPKAFCTIFLTNRNPVLYDSSLWPFVIRTPNGVAPAAHGVNKKNDTMIF